MDESTKTSSPCKDCKDGVDETQLRTELEHLRQHIAERDVHFVALENEFYKCTSRANDLEEQLDTWREKYERLYDSHKRVQKLNQVLEDKLLQMVDKMKGEKGQLTKDIATLSVRLAESKHNYSMLQKENERYKNDMNLAIQLLQCKPDNFVAQKLDNLPMDTQARVSQYVMSKTAKPGTLTPGKSGNDADTFDASEYEFNISASLMTKILEDSIQDTVTKHCDTCTCGKSQNKPFCYNETYYSISTQTIISGDLNPPCINCNPENKSINSNYSYRSISPYAIKLVNDKVPIQGPMYMATQPTIEEQKETFEMDASIIKNNAPVIDLIKPVEAIQLEPNVQKEIIPKVEEEVKQLKNNTSVTMEPSVHHKLCDRTKNSISSKRSSIPSIANDDLIIKEIPIDKEIKPRNQVTVSENLNIRKNSQSSMGGSRTSSIAKSTISTHKSNTHVGPGPRFCHLRMQAGSKNILLDNAEPDVPPVLYRRQSKCNENSIFKDLNDGMDNFINLAKPDDDVNNDNKNDNIVVESTLIDVHEDNNNKESNMSVKSTSFNPILLNVSSSPLQPLKTHNFSNSSEHNNNNTQSVGSHQNPLEVDHLLNDFTVDVNVQNNNIDHSKVEIKKIDVFNDPQEVKLFNFDRYEQSKIANQFSRPLKKIDMSQLHSIENTKISKDFPPQGLMSNLEKKTDPPKPSQPTIVNVYPNLTQTHLKVNENNKVFTNEQSTSSLSSDDSAALLQKQQLLRVAEWVEKNLEQQNNFNDPLEDECTYTNRAMRRDSKLSRLTETLNELALNMPHPVSKYSKYVREPRNNYIHHSSTQNSNQEKTAKANAPLKVNNVVKETIFPVECNDLPITEVNGDNTHRSNSVDTNNFDPGKELKEALKNKGDKEISPEDLARMEYNVKKFLLSGPHWVNPGSARRSRRTSSKTETDV